MKKLLILRHANANPHTPPEGLTDKERPISSKGWNQLKEMNNRCQDVLSEVQLVLCSNAVRTRQTLEGIMPYLINVQEINYLDELYASSADTYLDEVNVWRDSKDVILLIGHNPAVSDFLYQVTKKSHASVPTAGLAVYELIRQPDTLSYMDFQLIDFF